MQLHLHRPLLLFLLLLLLHFNLARSAQFYDPSSCSLNTTLPGSRYSCPSAAAAAGAGESCSTFLTYRAQGAFNSISSISRLFGVYRGQLLTLNNLTDPFQPLHHGREVIVPIFCSCLAGSFQSNLTFITSGAGAAVGVACGVFEGLCKSVVLARENGWEDDSTTSFGSTSPATEEEEEDVVVPLKCACPDADDTRQGILYLVTYPIMEFDDLLVISMKFGVYGGEVLAANTIGAFTTVFPNTTILVPLKGTPSINSSVITDDGGGGGAVPGFIPAGSSRGSGSKDGRITKYAVAAAMCAFSAILLVSGTGCYCWAVRRRRRRKMYSGKDPAAASTAKQFSEMSSSAPFSSMAPPSHEMVAAEFSKYSVTSYSASELRDATGGFGDETKLGDSVHRGTLAGGEDVVVKRIEYGDAGRVIRIHSLINHSSIVKLEGVSYGDDDDAGAPSYLVFEFARNGCLKECLEKKPEMLPWQRRTQIAIDVAVGLHYIHQCVVPSYIHMNINSRNILITRDWRAKIANLGVDGSVINNGGHVAGESSGHVAGEGWAAPEYRREGQVSTKIDVFAFGVVLFELISGKTGFGEADLVGGLRSIGGGGSVTGCFEELREFMDGRMKEDPPIGEALCMTVLAKSCVDDNPKHRPSMDDILKILARMACP